MGGDLKFDNLLLIIIITIVLYQLLSGYLCNIKEPFDTLCIINCSYANPHTTFFGIQFENPEYQTCINNC
jgi:hypothetical protein